MPDEKPVFALPVTDYELDQWDGKITIAMKTIQGTFAGQFERDQIALLAQRLLHWTSRQEPGRNTIRSEPMIPRDLRFEAGQTNTHIVLTVDLGAATLRFEVPHAQLGEALAQLQIEEGEPHKRH